MVFGGFQMMDIPASEMPFNFMQDLLIIIAQFNLKT
jgi:hypothetical protein